MDVVPAAIDDALRRTIDNGGRVCVLTGAGMSAESGIPTFRGTHDSLWSRFDPMRLATAEAWREDPALVWGWYRWRMQLVRDAKNFNLRLLVHHRLTHKTLHRPDVQRDRARNDHAAW